MRLCMLESKNNKRKKKVKSEKRGEKMNKRLLNIYLPTIPHIHLHLHAIAAEETFWPFFSSFISYCFGRLLFLILSPSIVFCISGLYFHSLHSTKESPPSMPPSLPPSPPYSKYFRRNALNLIFPFFPPLPPFVVALPSAPPSAVSVAPKKSKAFLTFSKSSADIMLILN